MLFGLLADSPPPEEFDTKSSVTATPVISGGRVYVAIDLATGAEVWRLLSAAGATSLTLDGNVVSTCTTGAEPFALSTSSTAAE